MVDRAGEDDPESIDQFVGMQPLGRKGTPEEVANAIVWLCFPGGVVRHRERLPRRRGLPGPVMVLR